MYLSSSNIISEEHTGNLTLPKNQNRSYFLIVMTSGIGTVEFGDGGGEIPLSEGIYYEPYTVPISKITIRTTGTYTIATGG